VPDQAGLARRPAAEGRRDLVEQGVPLNQCYPPTAAVLEQFHARQRRAQH